MVRLKIQSSSSSPQAEVFHACARSRAKRRRRVGESRRVRLLVASPWRRRRLYQFKSGLVGRKASLVDETLPYQDALVIVNVQDADRDSADLGASDENRAVPVEMTPPGLAARAEKTDDLAIQKAGQIRSFRKI